MPEIIMVLGYTLLITCCFLLWLLGADDLPYGKIGCGLIIAPVIIVIIMILFETC